MATVGSKIDKRFNYKETKNLDDDTDYDEESDIYDILFHNKTINVIFGKNIRRANRGKLCYIFIYLCENDALKEKIGLYEFSSKDEADFINKDGSIKLDKFIHPLWFSDFIKDEEEKGKSASKAKGKSARNSKIDKVVPERYGKDSNPWVAKYMGNDKNFEIIENEGNGDCFFDTLRQAYKSANIDKKNIELRQIVADSEMAIEYYNNKKVHFNGFFNEIVLALTKKTKGDIRETMSDMSSFFRADEFRIFFNAFLLGLKALLNEEKIGVSTSKSSEVDASYYDILQVIVRNPPFSIESFGRVDSRIIIEGLHHLLPKFGEITRQKTIEAINEKREIEELAKENEKKANKNRDLVEAARARKEAAAARDIIERLKTSDAYTHGKGGEEKLAAALAESDTTDSSNFESYKNFILSHDFWADELSIMVLEEQLNIKVIIVSEEQYNIYNIGNHARSSIITNENYNAVICTGGNVVEPEYYIMATKSSNHYRLVTYNEQGIFENFENLPEKIKNIVLDCTEKEENPYHKTRQILEYKTKKEKRGGTYKMRQKNIKTRKNRR